jgi:hypothetical protein
MRLYPVKFTVMPANHSIYRHVRNRLVPAAPDGASACANAENADGGGSGFRPWHLANGSTLGY